MNNGKEKPGRLALAMCPKRSGAPLGPLATECADRLCSCSQIHRSICSSEKKPQREKHLTHVLSQPHWYSLLLLRHNPDLIIPSICPAASTYDWCTCLVFNSCCLYSVENSCTAISSTASSTIHLQLPFSWKRSNLPPQCFFLHQISKFWTKGASALFHRNTRYG